MLLRSVLTQRFIQLSAGTFHCVALDDMGQAWVWGANAEGQLGVGDVAQRSQPAVVQFLGGKNVMRVAAGAYHTLFLTDTGELYSAGLNTNGQLGHGDDAARSLPSQVLALRYANISNIACGAYSSYAVTDAGAVYSWGNNAFGQLGLGRDAASSVLTPTHLRWFSDQQAVIYELFGGQRTVFAVEQSGHVYAIGNNEFGMLGVGDETTRNVPAQLGDLVGKNVYQIAAGAYHTLSVTGCLNLVSPCSGHGKCDEIEKCKCDTGFRGPPRPLSFRRPRVCVASLARPLCARFALGVGQPGGEGEGEGAGGQGEGPPGGGGGGGGGGGDRGRLRGGGSQWAEGTHLRSGPRPPPACSPPTTSGWSALPSSYPYPPSPPPGRLCFWTWR
jgi:hypothetical protein